jgi:hypothetical protein
MASVATTIEVLTGPIKMMQGVETGFAACQLDIQTFMLSRSYKKNLADFGMTTWINTSG